MLILKDSWRRPIDTISENKMGMLVWKDFWRRSVTSMAETSRV